MKRAARWTWPCPGFAKAIDANFNLRASIFEVGPDQRRLVDAARAAGGAAKFCGSGGAVLAMAHAGTDLDPIATALEAAGASVHSPVTIAP